MNLIEILKAKGISDDIIKAVQDDMKTNKIFTASEENLDIRYKKLKDEPLYSQEAARAEYPNAYKPWEEAEDAALRDFVAEQLSYDEIADHFQRKRGAIISRIKHLKIENNGQ
jgi:predicted DNA-binding protein YlxM (UPF0122 family)